jgi:hypothetical protein
MEYQEVESLDAVDECGASKISHAELQWCEDSMEEGSTLIRL